MVAPAQDPIPIDTARDRLSALIKPIDDIERVTLGAARGRFAGETVISQIDLPATHNAAVDGYGVHAASLAAVPDRRFRIAGIARAGHPFAGSIGPNEAIEIYTGGVMPAGPDCVAMHEDCTRADDHVIINKPLVAGNNMRPPGENLATGEAVIVKGQRITAALIGQLAASGRADIAVYRRLKLAVMSTGDEVVDPPCALGPGQINDANRPMLAAMLAGSNTEIIDSGVVPDRREQLADAYSGALEVADVVISSGGASDGIEDHTQYAMQAVGANCAFWRLAMKPGRPMAVGQAGAKLIFCLPGNPVAAFVCTRLLIQPLLAVMGGGAGQPLMKLAIKAGFSHKKKPGRAEYLRVVVSGEGDKQALFVHGRKGAGVISSLTGADGLVEIPLDNAGVEPGMVLNFLPFHERGL